MWGLETARQIVFLWAQRRVSEATAKQGLSVQFEGVEAWLLAQTPTTLEEAERVLAIIEAFETGNTQGLDVLAKGGGEHRRDGVSASRVNNSFAPRAYGPVGGRA